MEQPSDTTNPRKRGSESVDSQWDEESAKRVCLESSSSPHLKLLEDLYGLDAEDDEAETTAPLAPYNKEDLVAEMMKSLEKVIEDGEEPRGEGEPSTSSPPHSASDLDTEWVSGEISEFPGSPGHDASLNGELDVEVFQENAKIREMLQVSDDELGVPLSSSSSVPDPEETSFLEEWASLTNENSLADNSAWLEAPFQPFDDGPLLFREAFEPLLLF